MMNQIKELKKLNKEEFIIEIILILHESLKKFTISIFINEPVTVLELKEFISKDFDFQIEDMIIFYPHQGILENNYILQDKPNQKLELGLIIDDKKLKTSELHKKISLDYKETINPQNNSISQVNKINSNSSLSIYTKNNINPIDICNKSLINNNINDKNDYYFLLNINLLNNKNIYDIKDNIRNNNNDVNKKPNKNEIIKNNKCNFVLAKVDSPKYINSDYLLGKKRVNSTTFKTTLHKDTKEKALIKSPTNNNFKVINFNLNKHNDP